MDSLAAVPLKLEQRFAYFAGEQPARCFAFVCSPDTGVLVYYVENGFWGTYIIPMF